MSTWYKWVCRSTRPGVRIQSLQLTLWWWSAESGLLWAVSILNMMIMTMMIMIRVTTILKILTSISGALEPLASAFILEFLLIVNCQSESVFIECSPRLQVVQYVRSCHCERSSLGSPQGHREEEPNHLSSWGHPEPANEIQECVDLMLIKLQTCFYLQINVLTFITYLNFTISFTPLLQQLSSLGLTRFTGVVWLGFLHSYKWSQILVKSVNLSRVDSEYPV